MPHSVNGVGTWLIKASKERATNGTIHYDLIFLKRYKYLVKSFLRY
jgi:hypothetical protein